jgi:hypothetical protein
MNKSILEFLEEEYDYVPLRNGVFNLTEHQLEALLIHMAEDATGYFSQYLFENLEPVVPLSELSHGIQRAAEYTMSHYHGIDA